MPLPITRHHPPLGDHAAGAQVRGATRSGGERQSTVQVRYRAIIPFHAGRSLAWPSRRFGTCSCRLKFRHLTGVCPAPLGAPASVVAEGG